MNLKSVLNADMTTVLLWLRQGFNWWWEEISALLPPQWRERFSVQSGIVAELGSGAPQLRRLKDGQPLGPNDRRKSVILALPPSAVLTRELELPMVQASDLRRIAALEIDRYTPFEASRVHFDTEILDRDTEKSRLRVLLGVITRASASDILSRVEELGLVPKAMGVANEAGGSNIHFDFLPAIREAEGAMPAHRRLLYIWSAVAALLALNIGLLIARDASDTGSLRNIVESQEAPVNAAMHLREKVEVEGALRAALMARKARNEPLRALDAVTRALPAEAWVQHFEWDGRNVHLVGYGRGRSSLLAALEASPSLHDARSLTAERSVVQASGVPFDIAAKAKVAP